MTPIMSRDDERLTTLAAVALETLDTLSEYTDANTRQLLAESLYRATKKIEAQGCRRIWDELITNYPLLDSAIR